MPTHRKLKKQNPTRKTRRRRLQAGKNKYKGNLAIKRVVNMAMINGTAVDGTRLNKNSSNLCFTTTAVAGDPNYGYMTFMTRLFDVYNFSEFVALYDQYTIDKVVIKLTPYSTVASSGAAYASTQQQSSLLIHSIIDHDDVTAPTADEDGVKAMREYTSYKCINLLSRMGKPITFTFKPKVSVGVFAGGSTVINSKVAPFGWVDCAETQVEGYGIKIIMETISAGAALQIYFKAEATYYMRFKDPR